MFLLPLRRSALYLCFPLFPILYPKAFGFLLFAALNVTKRHDYVFTIIYTCKAVIGARLSEMPEILVDAIAFVPHDTAACNNSHRRERGGRETPGARELDRRNQPSKFQKSTPLRTLRYNKSGYVGISDKNSFISLPFRPLATMCALLRLLDVEQNFCGKQKTRGTHTSARRRPRTHAPRSGEM